MTGLLRGRIDDLEGTSIEQPEGLTWPQMQALADLYTAWHEDRPELTADRRRTLTGADS